MLKLRKTKGGDMKKGGKMLFGLLVTMLLIIVYSIISYQITYPRLSVADGESMKSEGKLTREVKRELSEEFMGKKEEALSFYEEGVKFYDRKEYEKAIERFTKALSVVKIPSFYLVLGNSHVLSGKYVEAIDNYKKALVFYEERGDKKNVFVISNNLNMLHDCCLLCHK
jgi:tetratricopeptide (TPR) repeat protein